MHILILNGIRFGHRNEKAESDKRKPVLGSGRNSKGALDFQSMEFDFRSTSTDL